MACLEMYNNNNNNSDNKPPMSPRISFSNDFIDTQQQHQHQHQQQRLSLPVSTDFEFSVTNNYSIMSGADELFFKGRLLPFRDNFHNNNNNGHIQRTIRDELLVDDEDGDDLLRPQKGSSLRWKGLLGLKRNHIGGGGSKKAEKMETSSSISKLSVVHEEAHAPKTSQEFLSEGGTSNCRDVEIGI